MKKQTQTQKLHLSIQSDLDLVSKTSETERILEIEVQAPEAAQKRERLPLNLAIVLDRSGSMQGEKLSYVKEAGIHLLDLLEEQDSVAVVVYNDHVDVLSLSVLMTTANRLALKAALQGVECRGNTCLSGGWLAGCQAVAEVARENSINRVLLLTDGLANAGIIDLEELARQSKELCDRGVSTSTFGVGMGFNEHLLEAMANQGGGNFYFIESPLDIPIIFQKEFKDLAAVTARDVEITLDIQPQIQAHVLGNWRTLRAKSELRISLGNMYSGRKVSLYVRLTVPALDTNGFTIHGLARGKGESGNLFEARAEAAFRSLSKEDLEKATPMAEVLERFARVAMADAATEALKLDREGKRQEALTYLGTTSEEHRRHLGQSHMSSYDALHMNMARGMDEGERKRRHSEEYRLKKMGIYHEEYPLHQPGGHIVIEVDGRMILVDTGALVSVGRAGVLHFLGRDFHLVPSFFNDVTVEYLSQKVGFHLDILMGIDILRHCYFILDSQRQTATFSLSPLQWPVYHRIPLNNFLMGVPTTTALINGEPINVFVDTSAVRCYIPEELTSGCRQVGKVTDFFPGAPDFETPVFEVPVDLSGEKMILKCGVGLPALLMQGMQVAGVRGILGMDLLRKYRIGFALKENELVLIEKFQ